MSPSHMTKKVSLRNADYRYHDSISVETQPPFRLRERVEALYCRAFDSHKPITIRMGEVHEENSDYRIHWTDRSRSR